jgi:bifunctional DNA-binding transcriptional regulator/antitoxin component of YhaV-PrlF toxin-antitoxin module
MGVLQTLRLGPNGELLLPVALREGLELQPGDAVHVEIRHRYSLSIKESSIKEAAKHLRAALVMRKGTSGVETSLKTGSVEDLFGCVGYQGPVVSVEDMDAAVRLAIAERRHRE